MDFSHAEIMELIREDGKSLTILIPSGSQGGNRDLGIPERDTFIEKPVIGYLFNMTNIQMGVTGGNTQSGGLSAYILGSAIAKDEIKPGSQLTYNGMRYRIEYQFALTNRNITMLHQLRLTPVEVKR